MYEKSSDRTVATCNVILVHFGELELDSCSAECEVRPYKRLAQAVLLQALQDLKALSNKPEVEIARAEAIAFFERRGRWAAMFNQVCDMAGYDPDVIHAAYRRFLAHSVVDYVAVHEQRSRNPRKRVFKKKHQSAAPRWYAPEPAECYA